MAGNTGKMTAEAIRARGPRMRLLAVHNGTRRLGFIIVRDDAPVTLSPESRLRFTDLLLSTYAKSYTLAYLLRIGRALASFTGRIN